MIPEAAVEAAAKAMVRISRWEDVAGSSKMQLMLNARSALEAAAPHMLAGAWEAGFDYARTESWTEDANPYRIAK